MAFGACLSSSGHDPWQDLRRDLVPSPACSQPSTTAIVLTTTHDKREFTVRINRQGITVDARHL